MYLAEHELSCNLSGDFQEEGESPKAQRNSAHKAKYYPRCRCAILSLNTDKKEYYTVIRLYIKYYTVTMYF